MALCPRIQRGSWPRPGPALGAARPARVVSDEAARPARVVSDETARCARRLTTRPLGPREWLAPRPLGERRGRSAFAWRSAEVARREVAPRAARRRRRCTRPRSARREVRPLFESAGENRPRQDLAGAFHESLTNGPGWRRKPVRFRYFGEVAKWLGNGLQNRYTRVRIPSSPPHSFSRAALGRTWYAQERRRAIRTAPVR
jgi:hypothetical protein